MRCELSVRTDLLPWGKEPGLCDNLKTKKKDIGDISSCLIRQNVGQGGGGTDAKIPLAGSWKRRAILLQACYLVQVDPSVPRLKGNVTGGDRETVCFLYGFNIQYVRVGNVK